MSLTGSQSIWFGEHVANCVANSAPDQAQKCRAVTKLNGLKTNTLGNINQIPKP
jgi:hypothetical protein